MPITQCLSAKMNDWLMRRALTAAPYEACGFILKCGNVIEIPNSAINPAKAFSMSRKHLVERVLNPQEIEAIWHTHPSGIIKPSKVDQQYLQECQWRYLIVTSREVVEIDTKIFQTQPDWAAFSR